MTKTINSCCARCMFFTKDIIGSGAGIGNCQKYDDYKVTGVNQKQLDIAFRLLGNELFWGGQLPRLCTKYEEK